LRSITDSSTVALEVGHGALAGDADDLLDALA
jgi:hypothetical protein